MSIFDSVTMLYNRRLEMLLNHISSRSEVKMKKMFKKSAVAMTVAMGLSGVASADSLLAPLIATDGVLGAAGQYDTFINLKIRGRATPNAGMTGRSPVNITYLQKNAGSSAAGAPASGTVADMYNPTLRCTHTDGSITGTPWDILYYEAGFGGYNAADASIGFGAGFTAPLVPAFGAPAAAPNQFFGMAIFDDAFNIAVPKGNDGDMSGFAYVIDYTTGLMHDYKLLNNHKSTDTGDFSSGFISKKVVDFAWGPVATWDTQWLVAVTSDDMTNNGGTGSLGGAYDATVNITQNTLAGNDSPRGPLGGMTGAYNNDENSISGEQNVQVTCMSIIGLRPFLAPPSGAATGLSNIGSISAGILTPGQYANSLQGGWARRSITPVNTLTTFPGITVPTSYAASGAIIYKMENNGVFNSFQIETSGHLSPGNNHANRPY